MFCAFFAHILINRHVCPPSSDKNIDKITDEVIDKNINKITGRAKGYSAVTSNELAFILFAREIYKHWSNFCQPIKKKNALTLPH